MIRDFAAVLWIGVGFLCLVSLPFLAPSSRGRSVRDPALAAVNDLGAIQIGERRAAVEARVHFVMRLSNGIEIYHHPACPVVRIDLRFSTTGAKPGGDDDLVVAMSSPYLASNPQPHRLAP